ncbi:MAG: hypothetical protein H6706_20830 [Myxococcales bacterium]|nr:hypothetical protein [Myxococcales bacterium]
MTPDMTTFLSAAEVDRLRAGYDAAVMLAGSQAAVNQHYAGAAPLASFLGKSVYDPAVMAPTDRERCILTLLATKPHALTLGVHVYWGLAEGLSLRDVYQVFMVAAGYAGVDAYAVPAFLLQRRILPLLKHLAEADTPDTRVVLAALVEGLA